ncbi:2,3-bisphosphoglycerate-independent phosphoglycerate mutase [Iodidimonas sp. SYSU 1G8]|uniref:2,3-bisphosphoglycerate-independent phosphoglycerate mutase n=1 Tax=Iodidimonas sp. SYSU 1G8 TaxID=3133967 RepID=UPI0031FF286F
MTETTLSANRRPRPAVLCILDGWGHRTERENNAYLQANTPNLDRLFATSPHALLNTSGEAVGLPDGQMGNSEVGHMNLGGGRVLVQDLPKIDVAILNGSLAANPRLTDAIARVKTAGGAFHVMGLLSPGGVHSHQDHLVALARIISGAGVSVVLHGFLDGRDTPPSSAREFTREVEAAIAPLPGVRFGTVIGRFYAMDRDKRWDRVEKAYAAMVRGEGNQAPSADAAIAASYDSGVTDEFVLPAVLDGYTGMKDGDGLLMSNFRADRAREILTALVDPTFDGFGRHPLVAFSAVLGMVEYSSALTPFVPALFPAEKVANTLGEAVSRAGLKQLRIAETEKYAHVTFFFNGGEEAVFENEDRILVPSPQVATYDLKPEMSAEEVADRLVEAIAADKYDLIVVNFANPDMVGHTGILSAAIKAMEAVDAAVGRLDAAVRARGGVMLVTADHGNLELMTDPDTGDAFTQHTTFQVPVVLSNAGDVTLRDGALSDVAPTMLSLMGIAKPAEMTGQSLILPARPAALPREARAQA